MWHKYRHQLQQITLGVSRGEIKSQSPVRFILRGLYGLVCFQSLPVQEGKRYNHMLIKLLLMSRNWQIILLCSNDQCFMQYQKVTFYIFVHFTTEKFDQCIAYNTWWKNGKLCPTFFQRTLWNLCGIIYMLFLLLNCIKSKFEHVNRRKTLLKVQGGEK